MKNTWMKLASLALALGPVAGIAADYPIKDKTVTLIVPFAAGGPTDRVARDLAEAMRKTLGASVVVENAAGGPGGLIGAAKVAKANPDGHTLLVHHIAMSIFPSLVRNLPFKVETDFEYLGMINDVPMTLIGKPQLPANNYKELMVWVNANKGKINLANAGLASASHLCGMLWQASIQVDMTTVPYKGTAPAMTDLIGGQVDLMCDQTTNTTTQIEGKKSQGLWGDHGQAHQHASSQRPAHLGRVGCEKLPGHHLARLVWPQRFARRCANQNQCRAQTGFEGPRVHQKARRFGCRGGC